MIDAQIPVNRILDKRVSQGLWKRQLPYLFCVERWEMELSNVYFFDASSYI